MSVSEVEQIRGEHQTTLHKRVARTEKASKQEYALWVLGKPHSKNKGRLLELTALRHPIDDEEILYYQIRGNAGAFESLLDAPFTLPKKIATDPHWYTFERPGHFYVDFAHPTVFGGGFRSFGNVQEETLFCEFPKLAHLAYATQEEPIHCQEGKPPAATPTPFIVPNVKRHAHIEGLYGNALERVPLKEVERHVKPLDPRAQAPVHLVGMAALKWNGTEERYTLGDLIFLLRTAFLAFHGAKMLSPTDTTIHTAPWGCGVFCNSEKTISLVQAVAAAMAGVTSVFHAPSIDLDALLVQFAHCPTPRACLEQVLNLQQKDISWAPKS